MFRAGKYRMGDMVNLTLRAGLDADSRRVIFGEDVEDPKGGVFTLTKKLSTDFPEQVFNSPLAESTILGVACGLASYGRRPIFELQFIDFVYPGWNQLVTNLATLRWRTFGKWTCPAVIYAPYGAYLPGGSLWHSQANEAAIAHYPGINVVIPSTPEDAAGLLWSAMHGEDPTIVLIPKHMLWAEREIQTAISTVPIGRARRVTAGSDVTVVAWGNTVEKSLEAIARLGDSVSVELIDLRSIVPWDREMIEESVRRTGRLVVVQEDTENCSVGQMIISHLATLPDVWTALVSPPALVSKGNVMIGYNPVYEYAALPDVERIVDAVHRVINGLLPRAISQPSAHEFAPMPQPANSSAALRRTSGTITARVSSTKSVDFSVKIPIMGEGIRSVRVTTLVKRPGEKVAPDELLCEVETDKAIYPIESSCAGVLKEWRCKVDDVVEIGREIAMIAMEQAVATATSAPAPEISARPRAVVPTGSEVAPALSPAITRRLAGVIPVNIQLDASWKNIHAAREFVRQEHPDRTPSLMVAWCITRAMTRHGPFRRLIGKDGRIMESSAFDLGVAVALDNDRLATAVIHRANELEFADYCAAYLAGVADVRAGKIEDVQAPLILTSLGAFGIEAATPMVVPPSIGTLFVGKTHERMVNHDGAVFPEEVTTLSLTFDHRVVNGAGAGAFLRDVKTEIERFVIPV
jgi:2-oxoisovalerate dehydrogenase E1 component